MGRKTEFATAVINGALGDHLVRTGNALATEMAFVRDGQPIAPGKVAPAAATGRLVVLVHGLMCTEEAFRFPDGGDFGTRLAADLGYTPLYLRYNSGRSIADNGALFAGLLGEVASGWPVPIEELVLLGYSMGGLVIRSACHVAATEGHGWLPLVRRGIYVGTPHRGAPLERIGRLAAKVLQSVDDPYTRLIAEIGNLRSDGVRDLGDADLRHEDRVLRLSLSDRRHPVPLLPSMRHYLVAGAPGFEGRAALFFGDAMVPIPSATDGACSTERSLALPPSHVHVTRGLSHLALPRSSEVYERIREWCGA